MLIILNPEYITKYSLPPSALDAATPGNTVVECTGSDYKALADEDTLKQNINQKQLDDWDAQVKLLERQLAAQESSLLNSTNSLTRIVGNSGAFSRYMNVGGRFPVNTTRRL